MKRNLKKKISFANQQVAETYLNLPESVRDQLFVLREMIYEVAKKNQQIGELTETLKWKDPAYVTEQSKSGSTIRLNRHKGSNSEIAIYFNCNTTLVDSFRKKYGNLFRYEKNRAILFGIDEKIPKKEIQECIASALTYFVS